MANVKFFERSPTDAMHCLSCVCAQVCLAAVGLVCDLCRALMANILPHCDEMMQLLLENLGVSNSHLLKDTFIYVCVCARMYNTPEITHLYNVSGIALLLYFLEKMHLVKCIKRGKRLSHFLAALTKYPLHVVEFRTKMKIEYKANYSSLHYKRHQFRFKFI